MPSFRSVSHLENSNFPTSSLLPVPVTISFKGQSHKMVVEMYFCTRIGLNQSSRIFFSGFEIRRF
jgi:hypothetical protein